MAAIIRPESKIVTGFFSRDLKSALQHYSDKFTTETDNVFGTEYSLFVREDPSYACAFRPKSLTCGDFVGVIVISYDKILTERIADGIASSIGMRVLEKRRRGRQRQECMEEAERLTELLYEDILASKLRKFSQRVTS